MAISRLSYFWPRCAYRSIKIGIWQFFGLELVSINVYTKFYQHIPYCWRLRRFPYLRVFVCFCSALVLPWSIKSGNGQAHWLELVGINRCAKISIICQNIPNGSRVKAIFDNCPLTNSQTVHGRFTNYPWTDRQLDYKAICKSRPYSLSTFFCRSYNRWFLYTIHFKQVTNAWNVYNINQDR